MSGPDLTRWNRAGLARLRYVDGNAATYYDSLRRALSMRFDDWLAPPPAPGKETPEQREERLLAQFNAAPGDWGVELAREVARGAHVLTEYLDAYANEASLRTATQWESVRRLVAMLDYHPAPPASASTALLIDVKTGRRGRLARGFAVKSSPNDGSAPVVFETLADLEVDAALNAVRLAGHDRSPLALSVDVAAGEELQLAERVSGLRIGEPVLLESAQGALLARLITGVREVAGRTLLALDASIVASEGFVVGSLSVHLQPADRLAPVAPVQGESAAALIGTRLPLVSAPAELRAGDVVHISDTSRSYYHRVSAIEPGAIEIDQQLAGPLQLDAAALGRAQSLAVTRISDSFNRAGDAVQFRVAGDLSGFGPGTRVAALATVGDTLELRSFELLSVTHVPAGANDANAGFTIFSLEDPAQQLEEVRVLYFPAATRSALDTYLADASGALLPSTVSTGLPRDTSSGDLAVMVSGAQLAWARLDNVAVDTVGGRAELTVSSWTLRASERFYRSRSTVHAHFKRQVRLHGWNQNPTPLADASLPLPRALRPELLIVGRRVWIEQQTAAGLGGGRLVSITDADATQVLIDPPLDALDGFTVGNTVLRANVVSAGHGERQNERILGSGIASASHQAFVLDEPGIAFVADPTFAAGVRADIDVLVDGTPWQQVSSLDDYDSGQPHYVVRMTEEGWIRVEFGDGVHGRRLTSGSNNVRIRFRLGTGLAGNVAAAQLSVPVRPHPLVEKLRQPFAASGGGDMESRDALKRNAPASLLTLERAVSSADYANLAVSHAAVARARAFTSANAFKRKRVEVVVVPAGGVPLDARLQAALEDFLSAQSQPGVEVVVSEFSRVALQLKITLRVRAREHDPQVVSRQVAARLQEAFALERREIGAPLYSSAVFAVVEAVPGVSNSSCQLFAQRGAAAAQPAGQRIDAAPREVVFLDLAAQPGALQVQVEEFEL